MTSGKFVSSGARQRNQFGLLTAHSQTRECSIPICGHVLVAYSGSDTQPVLLAIASMVDFGSAAGVGSARRRVWGPCSATLRPGQAVMMSGAGKRRGGAAATIVVDCFE